MADIVPPDKRSQMMSGIRGTNTKPELILRKQLFSRGLRYRLHSKKLPGKPDIVFPRFRAIIFVHGCFWHQHDCHLFRLPSTRRDFWKTKLDQNTERDKIQNQSLRDAGWRVGVVWECSLKGNSRLKPETVAEQCHSWLESTSTTFEITGGETKTRTFG